jgi:glycosyltransferase involved in cell wall biosynthesis
VGRLGIEKNFLFLLDAFKKISEGEPLSHLVIVGDGDEAQNIKAYAEELNLQRRVHFTGKISQQKIALAYADADIFVFASRTETQGIVLLEAAASGLPFVVVKDGAYKGMIVNNENGYLVSENSSIFAQKVIELLGDKEKKKAFGKRSKELVKENFNPKRLTSDMVYLYQEALINKKPRRISLKRLNTSAFRRLYKTTEILDRIFE